MTGLRSLRGRSIIRQATISLDDGDVFELLLSKWSSSVAIQDIDEALRVASFSNKSKFVRLLLKRGASARSVDDRGVTALMLTTSPSVARELIAAGADVRAKTRTGETALHAAAVNGQKEIVSLLLENGCPVDGVDSDGQTALFWAARNWGVSDSPDVEACIKVLLGAGADPNRVDRYGKRPATFLKKFGLQSSG